MTTKAFSRSVVLTDVTITNNTAQANGGGISLWKPETTNCTVELKGACTITGNTAGLSGGGIYHHGFGTYRPGPTLTMQAKPVVQDNAPTDVHLGSAQLITLSAAFTTGARIGVYCADDAQTAFTSGYKTCNGDTAPATYFFVSSPTVSGNVVWSGDNKRQLFIPRGFAHGFLVMSDEAVFTYKVDNVYAPQAEAGIRWDDPQLGIEWPIGNMKLLFSEKDMKQPLLKDAWLF